MEADFNIRYCGNGRNKKFVPKTSSAGSFVNHDTTAPVCLEWLNVSQQRHAKNADYAFNEAF
jgi:hypothetical protein